MDKILSITERLRDRKQKEQEEAVRRKAHTVQKMVQCSSCRFSCAMCGSRLDVSDPACPPAPNDSSLNLCECCYAEYHDFLEMSEQNTRSGIFWHNREWMELWSAWVEYRKAIRNFRDSREFKRLMEESE